MNSKQRRRINRLDKIPEKQLYHIVKNSPKLLSTITNIRSDKFYIDLLNYNYKLFQYFKTPNINITKYYIKIISPYINDKFLVINPTLNELICKTTDIEIIKYILEKSPNCFTYINAEINQIPDDIIEMIFTHKLFKIRKIKKYPKLSERQQLYILLQLLKNNFDCKLFLHTYITKNILGVNIINYIVTPENKVGYLAKFLLTTSAFPINNSQYIEKLVKYCINYTNFNINSIYATHSKYINEFKDDNLKNYIELSYICS